MAVEKSKVVNRLKALFPKANLSQKRLDALADKLASKPADDADDAAIDAVINDLFYSEKRLTKEQKISYIEKVDTIFRKDFK